MVDSLFRSFVGFAGSATSTPAAQASDGEAGDGLRILTALARTSPLMSGVVGRRSPQSRGTTGSFARPERRPSSSTFGCCQMRPEIHAFCYATYVCGVLVEGARGLPQDCCLRAARPTAKRPGHAISCLARSLSERICVCEASVLQVDQKRRKVAHSGPFNRRNLKPN